MILKDESIPKDPRLDRLVQFDERSKQYPVRELVRNKRDRSYTWKVGQWLDQGEEGACVGFSWSHELIARPKQIQGISNFTASELYFQAQRLDEWPGGEYPGASPNYGGTSVIAGAKAVQSQGFMGEYRWAFGLDDLRKAIGYQGPAVLGVNWRAGQMDTDSDGFIHVDGDIMGGHAILCYSVNHRLKFFRLWNSWGDSWGQLGTCKITFDDMEKMLADEGEACIPVQRFMP